jgi:type VI secretion system protein
LNSPRLLFGGGTVAAGGERAGGFGQRRRLPALRLGALLAAALLSGCGFTFFGLFGDDKAIATRAIEIDVAQGANQDSPIAIDIVYVEDQQMVPLLLQMTARDWFQKRSQMSQAFPTGFVLTSFELVPGQKGPVEEVPSNAKSAIAAFVFANYAADGTHRARIDGLKRAVIDLGGNDFSVQPAPT